MNKNIITLLLLLLICPIFAEDVNEDIDEKVKKVGNIIGVLFFGYFTGIHIESKNIYMHTLKHERIRRNIATYFITDSYSKTPITKNNFPMFNYYNMWIFYNGNINDYKKEIKTKDFYIASWSSFTIFSLIYIILDEKSSSSESSNFNIWMNLNTETKSYGFGYTFRF